MDVVKAKSRVGQLTLLVCLSISSLSFTAADFNPLEEDILFKINWPGPSTEDLFHQRLNEDNLLMMTTVENEMYKCVLPSSVTSDEDEDSEYSGPSALELLQPLLKQCTYKREQYWAYELCHGSHIKQFHEEKEPGKAASVQEYILGHNIGTSAKFVKEDAPITLTNNEKVSYVKVEGHLMPHVTVSMAGGTVCDLNGQPRSTQIKYVCHPDMKHEIYSVAETLTCEYEVLVLTDHLCTHPDYRLKAPEQNEIHCLSVGDAPEQPQVLKHLEAESSDLNPYSKLETYINQFAINNDETIMQMVHDALEKAKEDTAPTPYDPKLVQDFLNGEHCLYGGTGWWRYEFCYGIKVEQYHQEADGRSTVINLGKWNEEKHLNWLEKHPTKRPKQGTALTHVSHLYSDGDLCPETGKFRHTEVRLKCKNSSNHPNAVSLTLLEPVTCQYILLVESPILCTLLPKADTNGLM